MARELYKCMEPAVAHIMLVSNTFRCSNGTTARSLLLYHHFMRYSSEAKYDDNMVAAAAILLSAGVSEYAIDIDEVIYEFYNIVNDEEEDYDIDSSIFDSLKHSLITVHYVMQRMFEFNVNHRLPHQYLLPFISVICESQEIEHFQQEIAETCLKLLSDFFICRVCVNYKAEHIAVACIEISVHLQGLRNHVIEHWYQDLCNDLQDEKLNEIKYAIANIYQTEVIFDTNDENRTEN